MPFIDDVLDRLNQESSQDELDSKVPSDSDVRVEDVSEEIREILDDILNPPMDE